MEINFIGAIYLYYLIIIYANLVFKREIDKISFPPNKRIIQIDVTQCTNFSFKSTWGIGFLRIECLINN